jgi:hypothetical protein
MWRRVCSILTIGVLVLFFGLIAANNAGAQPLGVQEPTTFLDVEYLDESWREPLGEWRIVGDTFLNSDDEKLLDFSPGGGTVINGDSGHTDHLVSKLEHGDVKLHIEFMVPKGSNSGVYFQGRYEIQILDSWGVEVPTYTDCGGIYQRWRDEPGIDDSERGFEGRSPRVNAAKKPGEWQSLDALFKAPLFDKGGNKVADAEFVRVELNGVLIHENEKVSGPTRSAISSDEQSFGPLMLQGDHGPVAYRNLRMEPLSE